MVAANGRWISKKMAEQILKKSSKNLCTKFQLGKPNFRDTFMSEIVWRGYVQRREKMSYEVNKKKFIDTIEDQFYKIMLHFPVGIINNSIPENKSSVIFRSFSKN